MEKYFILIVIAFILIIAVVVIRRSRSNGSGIQDNIGRVDKLRDGLDSAGRENNDLGNAIDGASSNLDVASGQLNDSQDTLGSINGDNLDAIGGIRTAKDILERAKKRDVDG